MDLKKILSKNNKLLFSADKVVKDLYSNKKSIYQICKYIFIGNQKKVNRYSL